MTSFRDALSAVTTFLTEAKNLGLVKEFSIAPSEKLEDNSSHHAYLLISKLLNELKKDSSNENIIDSTVDINVVDVGNGHKKKDDSSIFTELSSSSSKKDKIQIQVDESEIKRRISAFISRKRKEVDEWNVQEFCSRPYVEEQNPIWEEMDSCARVDTVFVPRSGSKSHVKVSKVENRWGPQTYNRIDIKKIKKEPNEETDDEFNQPSLQAIEERIQNMEYHLKLQTETSRTNIFQRLKDLEDRILFLEGISPDYFHNISITDYQSPKKKKHYSDKEKLYSSWSVDEVQKRIQTLKEALRVKGKLQPRL